MDKKKPQTHKRAREGKKREFGFLVLLPSILFLRHLLVYEYEYRQRLFEKEPTREIKDQEHVEKIKDRGVAVLSCSLRT